MAFRAPKPLVAVGTCAAILIAACTSDRAPAPAVRGESTEAHNHGTNAQALSSGDFHGNGLPAKTLALTFDDGPGPRTKELSIYLKSQNIKAAFFMNGLRLAASASGLPNPNNITKVADPPGTLAQLLADGHLVANHTTTHRDLTNQVPAGDRVAELSDTDADIAGSVSPQNHLLFRAPYGAFNGTVFNTLSASAMNKYIGPINWEIGGFSDQYPSAAADWACWQGSLYTGATKVNLVAGSPGYATTAQCGDAYMTEITAVDHGIVLMHDPYEWAQGSTVDMVKYLVPKLVAAGYSFVRVDEVPTIKAALPPPPCDPTCATCSGPSANECTACLGDRYKSGGQCLACATCNASQYVATACTANANATCGACNAGCATCSGPLASQCTSCAPGKFLSGGTCLPCAACNANQYVATACSANANTVCGACDASCGTCTGPSATECASCTANKFLSGGACSACAVCGSGKFQSAACSATTDTVCGSCDASCTACSGPNPNQCGSCPPSFYVSGGACHACGVCKAGTYQATACTTTTNTVCTPCAAGTFTKTDGATTCTKCDAGTTSAAGATKCSACPAGQIASAPGSTSCTPCAAGTFAAAGATTCSACPTDTSSGPGATSCTACGSCDDGNACTTDRCDKAVGCVHDAVASCQSSSGNTSVDTDAGATDPPPAEDGCSVSGGLGRSGSGSGSGSGNSAPGMLVLAAAGMSLLARRRRS